MNTKANIASREPWFLVSSASSSISLPCVENCVSTQGSVCRGKALLFTLTRSLYHCQSGASMHASVGGVGIRREQGLAFCTLPIENQLPQHGLPTTINRPVPFTTSPLQQQPFPPPLVPPYPHHYMPPSPYTPPSLYAGCPLPAYQECVWWNNGWFYPPGTWNVSECGRMGFSEHALCLSFSLSLSLSLSPCFRRRRGWRWRE